MFSARLVRTSFCLALALSLIGCNSSTEGPEIAERRGSLTVEEERVLAFDEVTDWQIWSGTGSLSQASLHSEGTSSVAVSGIGYAGIRNATPITKDAHDAPELVGYDVWIPQYQPNPYWAGDTQLIIDAPSAGIHTQYLGYRSFENLPREVFTRVEFPLPDWIRQALDNSEYNDLRFVVAINVEAGSSTHYVDRFILGPEPGSSECTPTDDQNPCTADDCDPSTGTTAHVPLAPGALCSDGNACNGTEVCDGAGACQTGPSPAVDDGNPCTTDACDPIAGVSHLPVAVGTICLDDDVCNGAESCDASGTCVDGPDLIVDDGNSCTEDLCHPVDGVSNAPLPQGSSCSDGDVCNGSETCDVGGSCSSGTPLAVDDANPCTTDSCHPSEGVTNVPRAEGADCDDGDVCNGISTCDAFATCHEGSPPVVDDGNACTADSCDSSLGVQHVNVQAGAACGDGNACNGGETCDGVGLCLAGVPPVVDDGNPCTVDSCDELTGVVHLAAGPGTSCSDNDECNGLEVCDSAGTCLVGTSPVIDDDNPCTVDDCDSVLGVTHVNLEAGASCTNGDLCDGAETCDSSGACVSGAPPLLDDENPCTVDSCTATLGVVHAPAALGTSCADTNVCNGAESCNDAGACVQGMALTLDDENPCTLDSCDQMLGVIHTPVEAGTSCGAGNSCTGAQICDGAAECLSTAPVDPDDGNPCTVDVCDPATGTVTNVAAPAGTSCADANACDGSETCDAVGGCQVGVAPSIDDGNPCTMDSCDPLLGMVHSPVLAGTSCDDGDPCNGQAQCDSLGVCQQGTVPELDDGNPCTADTCDSNEGVAHTFLAQGTPCPDANLCNGDETCDQEGICRSGVPPTVEDSNPCTVDYCDPAFGVQQVPAPEGTDCGNSNVCDGLERCSDVGVCEPGIPATIEDDNPCTLDSCDPVLGVVNEPIPSGESCSNGITCDGEESCDESGSCISGGAIQVDDGNPCTADQCTESGVEHSLMELGTNCLDACGANGTCSATGECVRASSASLCVQVVCVDGTDVNIAAPFGTGCGDGDSCNGEEVCDGLGDCVSGMPPLLDDQNSCTSDSCDPNTGVVHAPSPGVSCSDGDLCNGGELCSEYGHCMPGTPIGVDDGNPCTLDSCNPLSGLVSHSSLVGGSPCSDGNVCNGTEVCNGVGACVAGTAPPLDDGDACTLDSCDPVLGVLHQWQSSEQCDDPAGAWRTANSSRPSPRDSSAVGYDPVNSETLIFGGNNAGAVLGDTWIYDHSTLEWRRLQIPSPPPRTAASMVLESANERMVLFGGVANDRATLLNDTWAFDLVTELWVQLADSGPSPRSYSSLSHDTQTGETLMYGGTGDVDFTDTWRLEGTSWVQLPALGPEPRWGATLTFDPVRNRHVLIGGGSSLGSGLVFDDSWELDASTSVWSQIEDVSSTLEPRLGHVSTYSAARGGVVVRGGVGSSPGELESWVLSSDSGEWSASPQDRSPAIGSGASADGDFGGLTFSTSGLFSPQIAEFVGAGHEMGSSAFAPGMLQLFSTEGGGWLRNSAVFDAARDVVVVLRATMTDEYGPFWEYSVATGRWSAKDPWVGREPSYAGDVLGITDFPGQLLSVDGGVWLIDSRYSDGQSLVRLSQWNGERLNERCSFPSLDAFNWSWSETWGIVGHSVATSVAIDPDTCAMTQGQFGPRPDDLSGVVMQAGQRVVKARSGGTMSIVGVNEAYDQECPGGCYARSLFYDPLGDRLFKLNASGTWSFEFVGRSWTLLNDGFDGFAASIVPAGSQLLALGEMGQVWRLDETEQWERRWGLASPSARSGMSGGWDAQLSYGLAFGGVSGDGHRKYSNELWRYDGEWGLVEGWNQMRRLDNLNGLHDRFLDLPVEAVSGHSFGVGAADGGGARPWALLIGGETDAGYGGYYEYDIKEAEWQGGPGIIRSIDGAIALLPNPSNLSGSPIGYFYFGGFAYANDMVGRVPSDEYRFITRGGSWTHQLQHGSVLPAPRWGHAMATDVARNTIVLFGGRDEEGVFADTWTLDLTPAAPVWAELTPLRGPSPRFGHTMVFDEQLGKVLLVGGIGEAPDKVYSDSWAWSFESSQWEPVDSDGLVARSDHLSMFDAIRGEVVVFGGAIHHLGGEYVESLGDTQLLEAKLSSPGSHTQDNGSSCLGPDDCASGHCVDGVCCSSACGEICGACAESGHIGECVPALGEPRGSRGSCSSGEDDGCGLRCNGELYTCETAMEEQHCGLPPGCYGEIFVPSQAQCGSSGACESTAIDCSPYVCNTSIPTPQCQTSCGTHNQCIANHFCQGIVGLKSCLPGLSGLEVTPNPARAGDTLTVTAQGPAGLFEFKFQARQLNGTFPPSEYPCGSTTTDRVCQYQVPPETSHIFVEVQGTKASGGRWANILNVTVAVEAL